MCTSRCKMLFGSIVVKFSLMLRSLLQVNPLSPGFIPQPFPPEPTKKLNAPNTLKVKEFVPRLPHADPPVAHHTKEWSSLDIAWSPAAQLLVPLAVLLLPPGTV